MHLHRQIEVLDPRGVPPAVQPLRMAERPERLDGRTVYLVDVRFNDGDRLLRQMQAWFRMRMPAVRTVFVQKSGVYTEDDPALFARIRQDGHAAILAVGH